MDEILKHWNLSGETVKRISTSDRKLVCDIGSKYLLEYRSSANAADFLCIIRLVSLLTMNNISVVVYVKTSSGEWTTPDGQYCLAKKINGEYLDFYTCTE